MSRPTPTHPFVSTHAIHPCEIDPRAIHTTLPTPQGGRHRLSRRALEPRYNVCSLMAAFHVAGEVSWTVASDAFTRSRQFSTARRSASLTESLSAQSNLPRSLAAWISSARRLLVAMASTSVSVRASTSATFHAHESMASESCRFRSSSNSGMPEPTQPRVRLACSALARMSLACSNGVTANSFASANCQPVKRGPEYRESGG